jgi:hypothetical protein
LENTLLEGTKMIYLANALFNDKLALKIYEEFKEKKIDSFIPDINIKYEGREININAFEQLRKRNPNNPYLVELKREILKVFVTNIVKSSNIIICTDGIESLKDQTIFEIAVTWYLNKPIYSYNRIQSNNRELLNAIGVISLEGSIDNFKLEKEVEETKVMEILKTRLGGRQKLTIQD